MRTLSVLCLWTAANHRRTLPDLIFSEDGNVKTKTVKSFHKIVEVSTDDDDFFSIRIIRVHKSSCLFSQTTVLIKLYQQKITANC